MAEESLRDVLLQAVIFVLILIAFFLQVNHYTDPSRFWLRYYGKDVGATVEGLFAVRGDARIAYTPRPEHRFTFDFTVPALLLAKEGSRAWAVRQQYGMVLEHARPLDVTPAILGAPASIDLAKDARTISAEGPAQPCAAARGAVLRRDLRLVLDAPELRQALEAFPLVRQLEANTRAKTTLTVRLVPGTEASLVASSDAACLLAERLSGTFSPLPDERTEAPTQYITLTYPPLKGGQESALVTGVALTLEDYTRGYP